MNVHLPYATHCFNDYRTYIVITFKSSKYLRPTWRTNDNVLVFLFSFLFFLIKWQCFLILIISFLTSSSLILLFFNFKAWCSTRDFIFCLPSFSTQLSSLNFNPQIISQSSTLTTLHHYNNIFVSSYLTLKIVLIFHLCTEFFNGYVIVPFSPMCAVLYTFILIFSKHLYIN